MRLPPHQLGRGDDQDKAYQLGYLLLDLVGERFLDDVLSRYKDEASRPLWRASLRCP